MPTTLLLAPRIFRPSYGSAWLFFVKMFCDRLSAHVSQCVQNEESRPRRHDCAVLEIATHKKKCSLDKDTLSSLLVQQLIGFKRTWKLCIQTRLQNKAKKKNSLNPKLKTMMVTHSKLDGCL
jgi:hypothetical protein